VAELNLVGKTLGSYQILEEVGRGGMAVVYRAYQSSLNREVAIKVLPPHFTFDQQFVARFHREARAAAGLRHPNIVVIYDVGEQGGLYYIVMQYLPGQTIRQLVKQEGPLPPARVVRIVEQIANALDYAHRHGFVHRDVKPDNIFVGEDDHVTLTDFGIAKAASGTQLTQTGMVMGTPEYMSPEQAEGRAVDLRTDLYALGVVLYQMLTGQVPFRGTTPHAILHAVIYQTPPAPRQLNPRLSPAIETVILKALAKCPEERFQSGRELAGAFRRAQAGVPVKAPVPTRRAAESATPRRKVDRSLVLALTIVALVLAGVVALFLVLTPRPGPAATETDEAATGTAVALWDQAQTATADADAGARATGDALRATERALEATAEGLDARSATGTAEAWERVQMTVTAEAALRATDGARQATLTAAARMTPEALAATQTAVAAEATRAAMAAAQTAAAVQATQAAIQAAQTAAAVQATQAAIAATQTAAAIPSATHTPTWTPSPTATPTDKPVPPTPTCALAVEAQLAGAWDRDRLGCPTTGPATVWAAWEPFERGYLLWRSDTDKVYVFLMQSGSQRIAGEWWETPDYMKWDGSDPDGVGLSPPPGLYEPIRGFGWLWRTYLDGPDSQIGWATDEEKGFCATIQPFDSGLLFRSNTVEFCEDRLFNWATHPSFTPLLFSLHGDGSWQRH
jgi:hypothetical protein